MLVFIKLKDKRIPVMIHTDFPTATVDGLYQVLDSNNDNSLRKFPISDISEIEERP
jgi:hypothetical protein